MLLCHPHSQGWKTDNRMAAILWVSLCLLMQACLCSVGQTDIGCLKWTTKGEKDICCEACLPGHRLVKTCGQSLKELCTPCERGTYSRGPNKDYRCSRCRQCIGVQVYVEQCTATTDTKCGCEDGLTCGDDSCNFCVKKCGKGEEPAEKRSCRPCPDGTYNDQIHQSCKPWSARCPNPDHKIVAKGNAFTDIKCGNVTIDPVPIHTKPEPTEPAWPLYVSVFISAVLMAFSIIIISIVAKKMLQKRKEKEGNIQPITITKTPIIRTPTDDPRTLIAIECSFHEAQQEQGSSSESLDSKDSSDQLIA